MLYRTLLDARFFFFLFSPFVFGLFLFYFPFYILFYDTSSS